MNARHTLLMAALLLLIAAVPGWSQGPADDVIVAISKAAPLHVQSALDEELFDYHVFEMDFAAINDRVRSTGRLRIHLGNQTFDLELEENNMRAEGFRKVHMSLDGNHTDLDPGPIVTFKGQLIGNPESDARLTITEDLFTGYIRTAGEALFIDPVEDFTRGTIRAKGGAVSHDVVVYSDSMIRGGKGDQCGVADEHDLRHSLELVGARADFLGAQELGNKTHQFRTLEVALECDGQYRTQFGNPGAFNRMEGIMNDVEGFIYEDELNLGINITFSGCWTSISGDPYTSLNASTTLSQMRNWWNANQRSVTRDNAHQFSGKDFSGGTIGIAFVGVICNSPSNAYGISQDISGSAARRRLTAHEIGHNLSAGHDNQSPVCPGVNCNGNGPIMCSFIQTGGSSAADNFSSCSFNDIDDHIDSVGGCI